MQQWSKKHNFTFQSRFSQVVYVFNLIFSKKTSLKIDFAYYPYKRLQKGTYMDTIQIDSLTDITVNKLLTISQRDDVKDFVDLYFLLEEFTLWDLMEGLRKKFNRKIELLFLASDLLKVEDFDFLPKMIKPLSLNKLKSFFREKAKELGKKSIE